MRLRNRQGIICKTAHDVLMKHPADPSIATIKGEHILLKSAERRKNKREKKGECQGVSRGRA